MKADKTGFELPKEITNKEYWKRYKAAGNSHFCRGGGYTISASFNSDNSQAVKAGDMLTVTKAIDNLSEGTYTVNEAFASSHVSLKEKPSQAFYLGLFSEFQKQ